MNTKNADIIIDIEVEPVDAAYAVADSDWIPSYKDAFEFIISEAKSRTREYLTPFNILMIKVVSIMLIVTLLIGGAIAGIIKVHIANEKAKEMALHEEREAKAKAAREEKRQAVIAENGAVIGKWYEMDASRDDIRTLIIEVDGDAHCVYTIGDEIGTFEYGSDKLSLEATGGDQKRVLVRDGDQLNDEVNGVSYYRTRANIDSLKFAEFLKKNLTGTYQDITGTNLYIYPDGTWITYHSWVGEHKGEWYMEINEGCVQIIFDGMGVHYGGGNIYKVTSDDYESEKAYISSGDFSLSLDVSYYQRISSKLP